MAWSKMKRNSVHFFVSPLLPFLIYSMTLFLRGREKERVMVTKKMNGVPFHLGQNLNYDRGGQSNNY